ncbi:MAG: hypothetical protein IPM42_01485 [Saprospiraceae bacterium]|nr:hypothetical protein [Saprospiraceae bacterium]
MAIPSLYKEEENKKKSLIVSIVIHLLLLLFLLVPFLKAIQEFPPPGGILVAFGDPDAGSQSEILNTETAEPVSKSETKSAEAKPTANTDTKVVSKAREDISDISAVEKASAKTKLDAEAKKRAEESKQKQAEKEKAEREAREKAEFDSKKKKYSDLFGDGKGNKNSSGNQGDTKGNPDGKSLEGISKGTGKVGGGLSGRGLEFEPVFKDNSQKTGKVVLAICVGIDGKVKSATYTQRGSTTSDSYLIELARNNALKYKFSKSDIESQCGTLTVEFKVQ